MTYTPARSNMATAIAGTTVLTDTAFTVATGDLVLVLGCTENTSTTISTPTATGGLLTFAAQASDGTASHCHIYIWTAIATGSGSVTVSAVCASAGKKSMDVSQWVGGTVGNVATATLSTGAPSGTITTGTNGSAVGCVNGDFAAVNPSTITYRSSATQLAVDDQHASGAYVGYYFYQQAASSGSQTYGMTAPTGQTYSLLAIEIKDPNAGGASAATPPPSNFTQAAVQRAASY